MSDAHPAVDAVFGGWQISGIFRWNTGLPQYSVIDDARWATNWNVQAGVTPVTPIHTCPDRPLTGPNPKLFGGCGDINAIYQSFRNAYPGESGPRNPFRLPGYIDLDLGLVKPGECLGAKTIRFSYAGTCLTSATRNISARLTPAEQVSV